MKPKTAHSFRTACKTKFFNSALAEKLIRERTGYTSDAWVTYG